MPEPYLELEQVEHLEGAADYLRDRLLIRLLFRTACRVSEVLGIAVSEIDMTRDTVTIEHLKLRVKLSCPRCGTRLSKTARFCPGCGSSVEEALAEEKQHRRVRTIPIDPDTMEMIREYIDRGGPVSQNGKQLLFGISRRHAWQIVRDCARRAGLPGLVNPETGLVHGVSPHRLRDAFAVHASKRDGSTDGQRKLQEQLGHEKFDSTAKYRKIAGQEQREWYNSLWPQEEV